MRLRIANWLKVKNKDILQDKRYNSSIQIAEIDKNKNYAKPLNGGSE